MNITKPVELRTTDDEKQTIKARKTKVPLWRLQTGCAFTDDIVATEDKPLVYDIVVAKPDKKKEDFGFAALINLLTDKGEWLQYGLYFDWKYKGWRIGWENFDNLDIKTDSSTTSPVRFDDKEAEVSEGDKVRFTAYLINVDDVSGGAPTHYHFLRVEIKNLTTGKFLIGSIDYDSHGATKFVGRKTFSSGEMRFTGLMTETFHYTVSNNNGVKITYNPSTPINSDALLFVCSRPYDPNNFRKEVFKPYVVLETKTVRAGENSEIAESSMEISYNRGLVTTDSR